MINIIIIIQYLVNLIILLIFHMHMFQLNSYSFSKHIKWMKKNYKKIGIEILLVLIPFVFTIFDNMLISFISMLVLGISIFYNFPKSKSKISFKVTNRVSRMYVTEFILFFIIFVTNGVTNSIIFKFVILNTLSVFICVIANYINRPIENIIQKRYIKDAKKIISNMPNLIVIGVTGSYGKTSVKNFLVKMLSNKYEVLTTPKNYNTTMGVVKTIRENLKATHQIFVCEMGATKRGDIKEICDIVKPKIGIITAIGPQHLESFKSIENIIKTKFELIESVKENNGTIFLNYDNDYLRNTKKPDVNIVSYGINNKKLNYNAFDIKSSFKGIEFNVLDKNNEKIHFKTKIIGKHNVINLMGAFAICEHLNINIKKLINYVRNLKSVEHRLEIINRGNLTIIDDSYNSNPISSKEAVDTLNEFEGVKIIVTPGLIELGQGEEKYNFEFGKYMANICDYIFLVGEQTSKPVLKGMIDTKFDEKKVFIVDTPGEALQKVRKLNINGKVNVLFENDLPDNYNL